MNRRIPLSALLLGAAGLIPPVMLTAVALTQATGFWEVAPGIIRTYAAIILSFIGGAWWGFASREEKPSWLLLTLAVVPSLAGWAAVMSFQPPSALFLQALLFVAVLAGDALFQSRGLAPAWWLKLRIPLSLVFAACCALSGWVWIR